MGSCIEREERIGRGGARVGRHGIEGSEQQALLQRHGKLLLELLRYGQCGVVPNAGNVGGGGGNMRRKRGGGGGDKPGYEAMLRERAVRPLESAMQAPLLALLLQKLQLLRVQASDQFTADELFTALVRELGCG